MVPAIRQLPEHLVNRIAAGEVIERPAAAAKELAENAVDAGATRIAVTLDGGGIDRIVVEDDGHGMTAASLLLAVGRHCTSKLTDDALVRITTLGFRGEALPSIGAAGRLSLTSRPRGAEHGHTVTVDGGRVSDPRPAAAPFGTRAVVADLFHATPARRKFLKSVRAEGEAAESLLTRLAFAIPHIAMRVVIDGRTAFDRPSEDEHARVSALLGPLLGPQLGSRLGPAAALLPVRAERDGARLHGFAAAPTHTRAAAAAQFLVVNGRPVADPVLRTAVRVAFRDVVAPGRHPIVALRLHLPAESLDVNVHPAKTELRFQDPAAIRSLVIGGLRAALGVGAGRTTTTFAGRTTAFAPRPALRLTPDHPAAATAAPPASPGFAERALPFAAAPAARPTVPPPPASTDHPLGAAVAQILDTYIVAVTAAGDMVLVDQHAAHERLTHEALRTQHEAGGVRAQPLLLPAVVDLPPADAARLVDAAPVLAALGLDLEPFGPGAVLVRALPAPLGAPDPAPLLRDLADALHDSGDPEPLRTRLDAVLARLACHGSIRAGRRLAQPEMDALLRRMEQVPRAATCPHGRPTVLTLSRHQIEALFSRR